MEAYRGVDMIVVRTYAWPAEVLLIQSSFDSSPPRKRLQWRG